MQTQLSILQDPMVHNAAFTCLQEVKDLLAAGPVPPDSKACLEKYFAETSSQ